MSTYHFYCFKALPYFRNADSYLNDCSIVREICLLQTIEKFLSSNII